MRKKNKKKQADRHRERTDEKVVNGKRANKYENIAYL